MLQNAIYSVISPEGCATILWRDPKKTLEASTAMKLSSKDLLDLKIIDEIVEEPLGGAHRDKDLILNNVRDCIKNSIKEFSTLTRDEIFNHRKNKFLSIGRSGGFVSSSENFDDLSMKSNFIDIVKIKFSTYRKHLAIFILITIIIISIFSLS